MRRRLKLPLLVILGFLGISMAALVTVKMFSQQPPSRGVKDGRLAACPDSPNCVSTQAVDTSQKMEPLPFQGTPRETLASLKSIVGKMPRTRLVAEGKGYLHYEFRSFLFRFVDDVEFFLDESASVVHFRSASRLGHSDFGVNRRRMEQVKTHFLAAAGVRKSS